MWRLGVSNNCPFGVTTSVVADSELGVEHKRGDELNIAHFGPSGGGGKSDGEPGIRALTLNPPRFCRWLIDVCQFFSPVD